MKNETLSRLSPLAQPFTLNRHNHCQALLDNPNGGSALNAGYGFYAQHSGDNPWDFHSYSCFSQYPAENFRANGDNSDSNAMLVNKSFMDKNDGGGDGGETSMAVNSFAKQGKPATKEMSDYGKISRPSVSITTLSPHCPVCSENVGSSSNDTLMEPHLLLQADNQLACHAKILMDKGKDRKDDDIVSHGAIDTLVKTNTELQVICPSVHGDITVKPHGSEASVPDESSSLLCNYDDSDLDSPCWKGTQVYQATSGVSEPAAEQLLKIEAKATNSLNPQGLQFYPGSVKINEYFPENKCTKNDLLSLQMTAYPAVASSTRENRALGSIKAGTCPSEVSAVSGTQCSKHIHEPLKGAAHNGSTRSSLLSASCNIQPSLVEDCCTSDSQLVTGSKNVGSFKGVGNASLNGLTHVFSPETEDFVVPSFPGVGDSSEFTENFFGASQSTTQKIDIRQATSEVSEPVGAQLKIGAEATNGLNPLARQFYPGSGKKRVNHHENECATDNSPSFQKTASSAVAPSTPEQSVSDSINKGSCPSQVSDASGMLCSKHFHELQKGVACNGSSRSSLLCSSCSIQSSLVEDCYASDFQLVAGSKNAGTLEGIKNIELNILTSVLSSHPDNVINTSFSGVGDSSEFTKPLSGASKCTPQKINAQLMINTMHDMSEKLIQNCSNDLHSLNEQEIRKIEHIISNLSLCARNKGVQRAPMPESSNRCPSYDLVKTAGCNKVRRMKALTIPHGHERQKRCSTISSGRVVDRFSSSSEGIGCSDGITGVIMHTLNKCHQIEEDMNPQALLYKKLWLEAEEAMCYMKYKIGQTQIKEQIRIQSIDNLSLTGMEDGKAALRGSLRISDAYKLG